jgi:hypothetical protein
MIAFRCSCGKTLQVADDLAGKQVQCPHCNQILAVPTAAIKSGPAAAPIQVEPPVPAPASKPRDDDRDERDDRARRRRPPAPASSSSWKIVLIVVGVCFAVLCCGGSILTALLVPAVQKVREAAARTQTSNNMKQLALAVHNFHDVNRRLPDPAENGLSWRVVILPFIEQNNLFNQFDKAQPWDGPNNNRFLGMMPMQFLNISRPDAPPGQTFFQFVTGPQTMFPGGPRRIVDIADGAATTLMIVEASDAVPWTKPADIIYDPQGPLPRLGDPLRPSPFFASFADAAVIRVPPLDERTLRGLLTANGGEAVDMNLVFGGMRP